MKRPWKTTLNFFLLAFVVVPIMIDAPPNDTTQTQTTVWGGLGQYALIERGCSGNILRERGIGFQEIGVKWSRDSRRGEIGILAHAAWDRKEVEKEVWDTHYGYSTVYHYPRRALFAVNPFVEVNARYIGAGAGLLMSNTTLPKLNNEKAILFLPSFHLRFGNLKMIYFDASFLQHPWLYSGNYLRIGLGSNKSRTFQPWFGLGFGPSDRLGLLYRGNILLSKGLWLHMLLRAGMSSSTPEPAIGLGITYSRKSLKK